MLIGSEIEARLGAVEECNESSNYRLEDLATLLSRLPDLEKGLVRIHYGRVPPPPKVLLTEVFSPRITLHSTGAIARRIQVLRV
jgi:DNA mismatch repair ATPase MutS